MSDTNKNKEYNTIKQILLNNKYDAQILDKGIATVNANTQVKMKKDNTNTKQKQNRPHLHM